MSALRLVLPAAWIAAAACASEGVSDDKLQGLVHPVVQEPAPIDVDRAAERVDELARAAGMPHRQVATALGAHQFRGKSTVEVREGGQVVDKLEVDAVADVDGAGGRHCRRDNSQDQGSEMRFVDGTIYVRPRYSKYHRRAPTTEDEPMQFCDDTFAELGEHLDLLAAGAELSDRGPIEVAGRRGRKIQLALAASPRSPARQNAPERAWRQTVAVRALSGHVILDQDTGAPLHAELAGTLTFQRDGKSFEMTIAIAHQITGIGAVATIAAPPADQTVSTFEHSREAEERELLLEGIAPPARKAPTPAPDRRAPAGAKGP